MSQKEAFFNHITQGYTNKGPFITLGSAMLEGEAVTNAFVNIPLKTLNRHGLVAGATGTGKTKTIQILSEHLSQNGIPVLMMDIKGDFSELPNLEKKKLLSLNGTLKLDYPIKQRDFQLRL